MRQNLYRKYRPQNFTELLGQDHIVKTLQTAVSQNRISHAYLFSGPRGTGKTSTARLLAKILNCQSPVPGPTGLRDACRKCDFCKRIEDLNFMDIIEIDAASNNSVDDVRDMREKVKYHPVEGKYKIYIIDEVHMLSGAAFNAFLKTLEEPPPGVVFILATTDPQKLPSTVISRCQCYDFHSISIKVLVERLTEVVKRERELDPQGFPDVSVEVLHTIAECVDGGFRDALSLLDQITSAQAGGSVSLEDVLEITRRVSFKTLKSFTDSLFKKDCGAVLLQLNELFYRGHDVGSLGKDLLEYLRRALLLKIDPRANQVLQLGADYSTQLSEQVKPIPVEFLLAVVARLERVLTGLKSSVNQRILFEVELIRIAQREISLGLEGVERRLVQVETSVKSLSGRKLVAAAPTHPGISLPTPVAKEAAVPLFQSSKPVPSESQDGPVSDLSQKLSQLRQVVTQKSRVMGAYFQNARVKFLKDGVLTLILDNDFVAKQAKDPRNFEIIFPLAQIAFGEIKGLNFEGPHGDPEDQHLAEPKPAEKSNFQQSILKIDEEDRQKVLEKPAVSEALKLFGGEIVHIEKK